MSAPAGFHSRELKSEFIPDGKVISIDSVISEAKKRGYDGELNVKIPRNQTDTYAIQINSDAPCRKTFYAFRSIHRKSTCCQ